MRTAVERPRPPPPHRPRLGGSWRRGARSRAAARRGRSGRPRRPRGDRTRRRAAGWHRFPVGRTRWPDWVAAARRGAAAARPARPGPSRAPLRRGRPRCSSSDRGCSGTHSRRAVVVRARRPVARWRRRGRESHRRLRGPSRTVRSSRAGGSSERPNPR